MYSEFFYAHSTKQLINQVKQVYLYLLTDTSFEQGPLLAAEAEIVFSIITHLKTFYISGVHSSNFSVCAIGK